MAELAVQEVLLVGLDPVFSAASAGGDCFLNDGKTFLEVRNASASPVDVTVISQQNCDQGYNHPLVVTVPATTGRRQIGPFQRKRFNDANGRVQFGYSTAADVTVAAVKVDDGV